MAAFDRFWRRARIRTLTASNRTYDLVAPFQLPRQLSGRSGPVPSALVNKARSWRRKAFARSGNAPQVPRLPHGSVLLQHRFDVPRISPAMVPRLPLFRRRRDTPPFAVANGRPRCTLPPYARATPCALARRICHEADGVPPNHVIAA
jgi:hypothetical protein